MTYINCEQDHIDNNIRHIFIKKNNNKKKKKHAMNNTNIYQLREKKNKHKNKIKYLLA